MKRVLQNSSGGGTFRAFSPPAFNLSKYDNTFQSLRKQYKPISAYFQYIDLTESISGFTCCYGGYTDGVYGYFPPAGASYNRILRMHLTTYAKNIFTLGNNHYYSVGGYFDGKYLNICHDWDGLDRTNVWTGVTYATPLCSGLTSACNGIYGYTGARTGGIVKRYITDPNGNFANVIENLDIQAKTNLTVDSFGGMCVSENYLYFTSYDPATPTKQYLFRVILNGATWSNSTVDYIDLAAIDSDLARSIKSIIYTGRYVYCATATGPALYPCKLVKIDTNNFTSSGVTVYNLRTIATALGYNGNSDLNNFSVGIFDGRYLYLAPEKVGGDGYLLMRCDTSDMSFSARDIRTSVSGSEDIRGYRGGFIAGDFGYLCPDNPNTYLLKFNLNQRSESSV